MSVRNSKRIDAIDGAVGSDYLQKKFFFYFCVLQVRKEGRRWRWSQVPTTVLVVVRRATMVMSVMYVPSWVAVVGQHERHEPLCDDLVSYRTLKRSILPLHS